LCVRRKPGGLVPLEAAICRCAVALRADGIPEFHGYELAKRIRDGTDSRRLTAYGTLYRALARLEAMGLLQSRWEHPEIPARENRPGRRLYTVTPLCESAAKEAGNASVQPASRRTRRRWAPT
jgi:DNA-binding PadR family transcriptional regulator